MKTDAKTATAALRTVKPASTTRSVNDAWAAVKITAVDGVGTMETSDHEIGVRRTFTADDANGILSLVSVAKLEKTLSVMKGEITFEQGDGSGLVISAGSRKVSIPGENLEDFADLPYAAGETVLSADGAALADAIGRTAPFAGTDHTRPVLTGIAVDHSGALIATNSYFLGVIPCAGIDGAAVKRLATDDRTLNIPARAWTLAAKTMKGAHVKVTVSGVMATIDTGETVWTARIIAGMYPNWTQLVPDAFQVVATMAGAGELRSSAEAANKLLNPKSPMRIGMNGGLVVRAFEHDGVDMTEHVNATITYAKDAEEWDGEFGCSPDYVAAVLKSLDGGPVTLSMISPLRPGLFESAAGKALLMPIRLNV